MGTGIGKQFETFSVSVDPDEEKPSISWSIRPRPLLELHSFRFYQYLAAIATAGKMPSIRIYHYDWNKVPNEGDY